jgi:uncharacterized protein
VECIGRNLCEGDRVLSSELPSLAHFVLISCAPPPTVSLLAVRYTPAMLDDLPPLHGLPPLHWAVAGAGIAGVTLTLLLLANRRLGLSTGFEDLCSLVLPQPYFQRRVITEGRRWRIPLLLGLVLGGFLSAASGGGWAPTWSLGMLDRSLSLGPWGKLAWMFVGGLCIGFGTRLAGGCTSGHGIFGLSNLERPSLISTLSFMTGGIVTTQLLYRVLLT